MKKITALFILFMMGGLLATAQTGTSVAPKIAPVTASKTIARLPASKVDFDAFDSLTREVKEYRKGRLLSLDKFLAYSKEPNTVILDTRSTEMYNRKHIKGAIHLNFSDFTQENLRRLIPSTDTRILIYCNNNFSNDEIAFATKSYRPKAIGPGKKEITLALNIPTFINLYGYGYKNVYELADLVSVFNRNIQFEGVPVPKKNL